MIASCACIGDSNIYGNRQIIRKDEEWCIIHESKIGAPVVTYYPPGGHEFPKNAAETKVKCFKEQNRAKEPASRPTE